MSLPGWRTVDFFRDIVETDVGAQDVNVSGLHIAEANTETAGYMAAMHRVTLEVEVGPARQPRSLSYIVKEKSSETLGATLVDGLAVFEKEREVYEHVLPEFERLWRTHGGVRFGPRMYKATVGPETVIVMEDLKRARFRMSDSRFRLPLGDVEGILSKLAKFHAASAVYLDRGGRFSELMATGIFGESTIDMISGHYEVFYSIFLQSLQERNFPAEYLTPLKQIDGRLLRECCRVLRLDAGNFNVLNHGDLWPYNVMFGDDDLMLLDFQTVFYGCFAADILYFFMTSAAEIVCDRLEGLLRYYHLQLVDGLRQLGYSKPVPSYEQLFTQAQRAGVLMLPPLSEAVAMTMAGMCDAADIEKIVSDHPDAAALRKRVFHHPEYVALLDRLIPKLFELGMFSNLVESVKE